MPFLNKIGGVVTGFAQNPQPGWTNEEVPADHADILAYRAAKEARLNPDPSDLSNVAKRDKAILLAAAAMAGKTPAQAREAFKTAWDRL